MKSRALLYPGIVEQVMKPRDPRDPEKAQVVVDGADRLYREIRIDNTLNDANGQEVALKPGAPVEVTVAVDPDCQEVKTAQETPVVRAGFRSGSPAREALLPAGLSAGRATNTQAARLPVIPYCLALYRLWEHPNTMRFVRNFVRFLVAVQLLPALESGEETLVGGQAVLEGVMMRSPHAWAIACRKPSGEMATLSEPLDRPSEKHKWMAWPVIRGVMTLGYAMSLGYRALRFSANVALEDMMQKDARPAEGGANTAEPGRSSAVARSSPSQGKAATVGSWLATANIIISVAFFIFMYKYLPLLAATQLKKWDPALGGQIIFNLVDGIVRIALFLLFIWGVSLWPDIRRVYEYHGAEHKTVFAFENGDPLETAAVQKYSTFHPRCGTSFLMTVMLISIGFYMLIPVTTFWARFAVRVAFLPLIAGVSYEIIRFAAKHRGSLFALMTAPGLWLQRITTKPPSDEQAQCAIVALDHAMALEKERGGELVIA